MLTQGYVGKDYHNSDVEFSDLMDFLSATYPLNGWLHNWSLNRWGDWRCGGNSVRARSDPGFFARNVHVWEWEGEVVGFVVAEYGDSVFIQAHPHHRGIEEDMVDWAERVWAEGKEKVSFAVFEVDAWRQSVLMRRGYHRGEASGVLRKFDSSLSAGAPQLPPGFRIMSLADFGDEDSYVEAVRSSFRRDSLDREWFSSKVQAPGYSHEWNICVISPRNRVASFADVRIDRRGGYAEIDPIGTVPDHQREGLAKACLRDCFRRLHKVGIRDAHIGSAPPPNHSNRLYDSLGPVLRHEEYLWEKELSR